MSRISTRKFSTLALLTSAVFTISSLAPVEFAPGPFSPDAAFAKSENANGGNSGGKSGDKGGNGGGKSGDNGGNSGGKGGEKSTAKGSSGGSKGLGKGVGDTFAKATKKGGDLINSVFGRDKAKAKKAAKTEKAAAPAKNPKTTPKDMLAEMGYHPSQVKGWNGVFHANPNAALHASVNSIHGRAATAFAQQIIADNAMTEAEAAAATYEAALAVLATDSTFAALDPTAADYDAALAELADQMLADLAVELAADIDAIDSAIIGADYDAAVAALTEANALEAAALTDFGDAATVQALQDAAELEQAEAKAAFEAVTPNVEYSKPKADHFYSMMEENVAMMERVEGIVEDDAEAAAAAAEAAAAEEEVSLIGIDGETIALAVQ